MSLTWPWALVALAALPLLFGIRWWMRRRRRRDTIRVSNLAVVRAALPGPASWRRRIPLWLFAGGLVVLGVAATAPTASVPVPANSTTILLAIDVSASMCATDVTPNRLTAAKKAAQAFIAAQPDGTRIGIVAFAGIAALVVEPTTDKRALQKAIDELRTSRGTAIGQAVLAAIDALAETNPRVPPTGVDISDAPPPAGGDYEPDTIVVLTDGRNTQGVDPVTAAAEAAARRLRVFTIGFGTTATTPLVCTADQISGDAAMRGDRQGPGGFGGGGGGGGRFLQIDEEALNQVADLTGGRYFRAEDAQALTDVLLDLPASISVQWQDEEITVWFVIAGALLVLFAVALSLWWSQAPARRTRRP